MKTKENFVLRQVAANWVVLPLGAACLDFDGMLTLNDAGVLLWRMLEQGCNPEDLVARLTSEYDVDCETASADVEEFLKKLISAGCLEY